MSIDINSTAQQIFTHLSAQDGNADDKIGLKTDGSYDNSIWNTFADAAGGKHIKHYIEQENALKSIRTYLRNAINNATKLAQIAKAGGVTIAAEEPQTQQTEEPAAPAQEQTQAEVVQQALQEQEQQRAPEVPVQEQNGPETVQQEEEKQQEVQAEAGKKAVETGDYVSVQNADGTSYQINTKEHTITKYDAEGKIIEQRTMTEDEQSLPTKDLITNLQESTLPAQPTEVKTEPTAENPEDDGQKQLSQEQIKQKVDNLKPGETFTYQETITGPGYSKTSTVEYTRNEDETLSKVTYQLNGRKFSPLTTTYSQDGKVKSQQEISTRYQQAIVTKEFGDDGNVSSTSTDLSNYNEMTMSLGYKLVNELPRGNAKEQTVKSSNGQTLVIYKDGQFYNAKGKQITPDKAYKILDKANDKKEISQLIEEY